MNKQNLKSTLRFFSCYLMGTIFLSVLLVGCTSITKEQSGVKDTVIFIADFNKYVNQCKSEPTKENLSKIVELITTSDIELNDEEKKIVDQGLAVVKEQAAKSGQDALNYWNENKEDIYSSLLKNGNVLKESINEELQNYLNNAKEQGLNWLKGTKKVY